MGNIILIDEKQLAEDLLISERRVRELFKEFKYAPGEYIYPKCIRKYIKQVKTDTGEYLTLKSLGEVLGLTERTIRNLTDQSILKRGKNKKYHLKTNVQNYLENYIKKTEEGNKLKAVQREMQEFKLKILKDEYHSAEIINELLADIFIKFRSQLLSSSRKIAVEIEQNENVNIKETVEKRILKALDELSRYNPPSNKGDK